MTEDWRDEAQVVCSVVALAGGPAVTARIGSLFAGIGQAAGLALLTGDAIEILRTLPAASVHCVVTSPPYYGLRDYGGGGQQIGLEASVEEYAARLVEVFREVRRVLRPDGTAWLNLGDSFARAPGKGRPTGSGSRVGSRADGRRRRAR